MAAGLLAAGCRRGHDEAHSPGAPVEVRTAAYTAGEAGGALILPGRIKAAEEVLLTAKLAARLTALPAREGARVRRDDALARFDAPEARRMLAAARAEEAAAALAQQVASRQGARIESLFVARVVSDREREVAAAEARAAEARLAAARASLEAVEAGSTVRAPFDAVVVRVHADPGADLSPGAPLIELRSLAGLEVVADIPEREAAGLARAALSVRLADGAWRPARLARLDGMTDWRSRSRTAHLTFEGPAEPGAFAEVAIGARPEHAGGGVPESSLVTRGALTGVYVIEDGHARLRWLKLGRAQGGRIAVLAGLEPGETYALSPDSLRDGASVSARP